MQQLSEFCFCSKLIQMRLMQLRVTYFKFRITQKLYQFFMYLLMRRGIKMQKKKLENSVFTSAASKCAISTAKFKMRRAIKTDFYLRIRYINSLSVSLMPDSVKYRVVPQDSISGPLFYNTPSPFAHNQPKRTCVRLF